MVPLAEPDRQVTALLAGEMVPLDVTCAANFNAAHFAGHAVASVNEAAPFNVCDGQRLPGERHLIILRS